LPATTSSISVEMTSQPQPSRHPERSEGSLMDFVNPP
jgi:hypothetical protein